MEKNKNNITSLKELKEYSRGKIVELPPFSENQTFYARIKRPSLLSLVKQGKIPNQLLSTANTLFAGKATFSASDEKALEQLFDVLDVIADACFVEPTYSEIKETGLELTDNQYMFIFNYSQNGVEKLKSFREESRNTDNVVNVQNVQSPTKWDT